MGMAYSLRAVDKLGSPFQMVDEGVFVIPRNGLVELSKHHFKILFILDGRTEHEIDGLEGRQVLAAGDILVAPIVGRHRYINPHPQKAASVQLVRLFLDADHLRQRSLRRIRNPEADVSDFVLHHFRRVSQLTGGIDTKLHALIGEFRAEAEERGAGYRHRVRSICTEMIVLLARKIGQASDERPSVRAPRAEPLVNAAREYIVKHFARDLTLGEIAWHVGKGGEHLARQFKRRTGQSVFDYVREVRIAHAKTLLSTPALTLTEIADRCGFHSLSFFSRTFRACTGMAPSQYRAQLRTELQSAAAADQRKMGSGRRARLG
jgi:AraC-like DNA-binding protein